MYVVSKSLFTPTWKKSNDLIDFLSLSIKLQQLLKLGNLIKVSQKWKKRQTLKILTALDLISNVVINRIFRPVRQAPANHEWFTTLRLDLIGGKEGNISEPPFCSRMKTWL